MSKRQICIYQQTGILDLTAIQSLSACHVSPRATAPSPKARGSHASDTALLAYLLPIQRPPPTKKTPEGQNKVSYLWMCQHRTSWNPGCTLSNEPDNSTGAFSSQEKWYLQKALSGWNQKLRCRGDYPRRGGRACKSPRHYPALISGNSTCYIWWTASEYQMPDNDGMKRWSWTKDESGEKWSSWQLITSVYTCALRYAHVQDRWHLQLLKKNPGASFLMCTVSHS